MNYATDLIQKGQRLMALPQNECRGKEEDQTTAP